MDPDYASLHPGYACCCRSFHKVFGVTVDELIGREASRRGKRGPAPKLQQQLVRISQLPKSKQKFVMEMLDTVLKQAG